MLRVCNKCNKIHHHDYKCKKKVASRNVSVKEDKLNNFYRSYQWNKLKNQKKKDELFQCEICREVGKIGFIDEVHHVKKISTDEGWEARLDYDGLLGVCIIHHKEIEKLNLKSKKEIFDFYLKK